MTRSRLSGTPTRSRWQSAVGLLALAGIAVVVLDGALLLGVSLAQFALGPSPGKTGTLAAAEQIALATMPPTRTSYPARVTRATSSPTLTPTVDPYEAPPCPAQMLQIVSGVPLWQLNYQTTVHFKAGLAIAAYGAPNAFHPRDGAGALDYLANAGSPGDWHGLATDEDGQPFVQGPHDPFPGFYVSKTALQDLTKPISSPARYVDARNVPYIVLPPDFAQGVQLGDLATVVNLRYAQASQAIVAGWGQTGHLGEGSIALAKRVQVVSDPRWGGAEGAIFYIVYPDSGNGLPWNVAKIDAEGARLFEAWGGMLQVTGCLQK